MKYMLDNELKTFYSSLNHPMQLRQAAALHHARYRGGFHFAASLAAAQAEMKFAVAYNTPALGQLKKRTPIHRIRQS
jgi:hypothetical protein